MMARCPNCKDGLGEQLKKYTVDGEAMADFVCANCDHEWSLSL
ncbi:hypothetical protein C478_18336 [Natrinema thermotolerans DSM 11552]|nr:hypothetical protein C478_18336 [Natrinema thermotolerans DSM 11552]